MSADQEAPGARHHYTTAGIAVLEERIKQLEKDIVHERELREQATKMFEVERARQDAEYARRLAELNGAHDRQIADRSELVQKSVYEVTQRDLATWKLQVTTEMTVLSERFRADQAASTARLARSQWVVSLALGVLMLVLAVANFLLAHAHR